MRRFLAAAFVVTGVLHFWVPGYFIAIVPGWLPRPDLLVAMSGAAEVAGGVGLLVPPVRRHAGIGLIALLVAVFPANIGMLADWRAAGGGRWYEVALWVRLPVQLLLIWMVHRAAVAPPADPNRGPSKPAVRVGN